MFKTREKDYTGCQPDIAEALKSGKEVLCNLSDSKQGSKTNGYVRDYVKGNTFPYATKVSAYKAATPVEVKQRVKKASEIVKWLEDHGYEVDEIGDWENEVTAAFSAEMFQHCGKEPCDHLNWLPEWLEEVIEC